MSIRLLETTEPPTPPSGRYWLYVDVTDARLKGKDDAGLVTTFGSGGVGTSTVFGHETVTLTTEMIAAKELTLTFTPTPGSSVQVVPVGGPTQVPFVDYDISGSVMSWDGLGLDGILDEGDQLVIYYQRNV